MHLPVNAYIYKENHGNVEDAASLFKGKSDCGYKVHVKIVSFCPHDKHDYDYQIVIESFNLACDDDYVIICKSTAVSASSCNTILNIIEKVVNDDKSGDNCFDIFYLSKWLDRCDQYSNVHECESGLKIVNTVSPNGVHCLMFSPRGREKFMREYHPDKNPIHDRTLGQVLNARIGQRGNENVSVNDDEVFTAITTTPSLINYDIINGKGHKYNNLKLSECRDIPDPAKPEPTHTTSHMAFFWLLIIIVFVVLISFILVRYYIDKRTICYGEFCPAPPRSVLPAESALF